MGRVRVRHVIEVRGAFYFQATPAMRAAGLFSEPLGRDRARAIARADMLNAEWDALRQAGKQVSEAPAPGSASEFIARLRNSTAWTDKSPRTLEELEYAVARIEPVFGPTQIAAVVPDDCQAFYDRLRATGSIHKAWKVFKWLRWVFNRAEAMGVVEKAPTRPVRVRQPGARALTWEPEHVEAMIAAGERLGLAGATLVVAIIYDTSLRPSDVRTLTPKSFEVDRLRLVTAKTGRPQLLPLWPETVARIESYLESLGAEPLPDTPLIRTRTGRPYSRAHLGRDVRRIRAAAGIPPELQLRDLRRTASRQRAEAGASEAELAAGTGHSIGHGSKILETYNPPTFKMAKSAQDKRRRYLKSELDRQKKQSGE